VNQEIVFVSDPSQEMADLVAALFMQHHREIFAYLVRLLGDAEWAHDLTQDVFLQLFSHRNQLADVQNRRAWIYRIAGNMALNALKRRRRFVWLPWRKGDSLGLSAPGPDEIMGTPTAVSKALTQLPENYRMPLLLYSYEEFSVREIAHILQISEGAVKNRLYRAREKFRQIYESENEP